MTDPAEIVAVDPSRRRPARETSSPTIRQPGRLVGKVALITGGDTGIGRATAVRFAREGADVAFTHVSWHAEARELVRVIERVGRAALAVCGDVDDPAFCDALVRCVVERFGGVDILVNNLAARRGPLVARRGPSSFFALYYLTRRLLPHLRDRPGASIINTASVRDGDALRAAIGACTRSLAINLARVQIRVNAVAPERDGEYDLAAADLAFLASDVSMNGELLDPRGR